MAKHLDLATVWKQWQAVVDRGENAVTKPRVVEEGLSDKSCSHRGLQGIKGSRKINALIFSLSF